jgi:hypothetical protein
MAGYADGIEDRDADVWEALLAVADAVDGDWPKDARKAAVALVAAVKEAEPSLNIRLLADIKEMFANLSDLSSKELLARLNALDEAPWGDLKGKPLDERGLARRLRQFDIKPKVIRIGGSTPRGYAKDDFFDAWKRYLPQQSATPAQRISPYPQKSATSTTSATTLKNNGFFVADKSDVADTEHNVAAVEAVAHFPGDGRQPCAQCAADDGKQIQFNDVWLHKECKRFYSPDLTVPPHLDRRGEFSTKEAQS